MGRPILATSATVFELIYVDSKLSIIWKGALCATKMAECWCSWLCDSDESSGTGALPYAVPCVESERSV